MKAGDTQPDDKEGFTSLNIMKGFLKKMRGEDLSLYN